MNIDPISALATKLGVSLYPHFLLPNKTIDMYRWAVIACDQYTSELDYWQKVEELVNSKPSTLQLILPEVFLENENEEKTAERIKKIKQHMKEFLAKDILKNSSASMLLLERSTPFSESRKGILLAIDLEKYDFTQGSKNLIRATEETVSNRIAARLKIREEASIELPHVLLLFDDPNKTVIEPVYEELSKTAPHFETDLMFDGGHLKSWKIYHTNKPCHTLLEALSKLERFKNEQFLFASGDGNHSLATAKAHWENIKKEKNIKEHPARYALVEICNIYDEGLRFEPIHRVLKHANIDKFLNFSLKWLKEKSYQSKSFIPITMRTHDTALPLALPQDNGLVISTLQELLDDFIAKENSTAHPPITLDYIHGMQSLQKLAKKGYITFELPALKKEHFFDYLSENHLMPQKAFSLGEANEKRYYLECRKIIP